MAKKARQSKTMWYNTVFVILEAILLAFTKDIIPMDPALQGTIIIGLNAGINVLLRLATTEGIELKKKETSQ